MRIDNTWIYWKEQCHYCKNNPCCEYKEAMFQYIEDLEAVKPIKNIYGTLKFICDYFIIDKEKYEKENLEYHCCG